MLLGEDQTLVPERGFDSEIVQDSGMELPGDLMAISRQNANLLRELL